MKQFFARKRMLVIAGVSVLALSAVAVAYFSTTGTGSGKGSVTAAASSLTLSGGTSFATLGETKAVTISASNPGTSTAHISSISVGSIVEAGTCPDESFAAGPVTTNVHDLAAGATNEPVATVDITFVNLENAVQNGCIGDDKVTFNYSSN